MKKLVSLIFMVLLMLCLSVTAFAGSVSGLCGGYDGGGNVEWSLVLEEGTLLINGYGPMADFSEEEPAPWYQYREFIKKIRYEGAVERIGSYAFKDCSNISGTISFPENLHSIGNYAFENCTGFTGDLVIPAYESIGKGAFKNCTGFSGDLVIDGCRDLIDDEAFMNCSGFKGKLVLGKRLNDGSERIGARAFMNCTGFEKDVIVPYMIKNFGNDAFKNCGADNFYFYSDSPTLEEGFETNHPFDAKKDTIYRFLDCINWDCGEGKPWEGFALKENKKDIASGYCGGVDGFNLTWRIDCNDTLIISGEGRMANYYPEAKEFAPWYQYAVRSIIVEEGVTDIGDHAFYQLSNLNGTVSLPSTLEAIGTGAFKNCRNLSGSLVIPEGVTSIGHYAFYNCEDLDGILVLPESLTFIGAGAFQNCESLSCTVIFPKNLEEIGYDAFLECNVNDYYFECDFPDPPQIQGATDERPSFDAWDTLHFVEGFPLYENQWVGYTADNVGADTVIDSGNCGAMGEQIDVQWSLTASGKLTISGSGKMRDYEKKWLDYLGGWGCTAPWYEYYRQISSIVIEEGVEYIGDYAFYRAQKATNELVLPESLTGIGEMAFNGCNNLYGELEFSENLTFIGAYAFGYCFSLTGDLIIPDSVVTIEKGAFIACRGFNGKLVISENLTKIDESVFDGCYNLTGTLLIPEGVTEIGYRAFASCRKLSGDLIIPDSVVTIGGYAFENCHSFDGKLIIGSGVTTIGSGAFRYCRGLTGDLIIPDGVTLMQSSAFEYCSGLDGKLVIGSGLSSLREYVFEGCEKINKEVYIPANIRYISYASFRNCGGKYYTFEWDPPVEVYEATDYYASFDEQYDHIIFPEENTNWNLTDGKWMGYTVGRGSFIPVSGDMDADGEVNVKDAYMLRLVAAKLIEPTEEQLAACDVDLDGKITAIDANIIRKYAVGIIKEIPVKT